MKLFLGKNKFKKLASLPHLRSGSPVLPFGQEQRAFPVFESQTAPAPQGLGSQGSGIIIKIELIFRQKNVLAVLLRFK